ncbi:MAG TPA: M23 family metallopeptidase [Gammaproteobacteria bacterium]|nr:M23 family metallopeptidase [Gammaproteobacteria bacterium]
MKGFALPGRLARLRCTKLLGIGALLASGVANADRVCAPRECAPQPASVIAPAPALAPLVSGEQAADAARGHGVPAPLDAGGSRASLGLTIRPPSVGRPLWSSTMDRHEVVVGAVDADHDDTYAYRLPYADDQSYPVTQGYRARLSHRGAEQFTVDFGMPAGTAVHVAREGVVVLAEDSHATGCWSDECARLANFVVVLHADGTTGEYFHLQRGSVQVRVGDRVQRGQRLALSGNTGYSTAPHLHFGVYRTGRDGGTQSVAVRFLTREGVIGEPRTGARYLNVARGNVARAGVATGNLVIGGFAPGG